MTDRDPEPGKSAQPKSRGPLGKLLLLAIVLLVLLVAFVALLPTILSTDGFRNTLVDGANESLGGAIEIDGLHFSWGGEQRIEGLRLWPEAVGRGEPLLSLPSAGRWAARTMTGWSTIMRATAAALPSGLAYTRPSPGFDGIVERTMNSVPVPF